MTQQPPNPFRRLPKRLLHVQSVRHTAPDRHATIAPQISCLHAAAIATIGTLPLVPMYRMAATAPPYSHPNSSEESNAPRRGFMSSGAAQLSSRRGGRCRHRGAVMDCPAPQTLQPERGSGRPAGGRRRRGRPGCPDAGHGDRRWVRVRCPPCGRTSVQLVGRTSGVQATGVHATGVIRGVRTDTRPVSTQPLQPRCPDRAGSRNPSVRPDRPHWRTGLDLSLWSVRGLVVAARIGPGGKEWSNVGRAWLARGSTPDLDCHLVCVPAAAPPSLLGDHGSWPSAGAGRLAGGAGEGADAPSPSQVRPGQVADVPADMGLDGRW
jgi:hypothetical protein